MLEISPDVDVREVVALCLTVSVSLFNIRLYFSLLVHIPVEGETVRVYIPVIV